MQLSVRLLHCCIDQSVSDQRISQAVKQSVTYEDIAFGDGVHVNGSLILHLPDTHLTHHTPHNPPHLAGCWCHLLHGGLLRLHGGLLLLRGGVAGTSEVITIRLEVVLRGPHLDGIVIQSLRLQSCSMSQRPAAVSVQRTMNGCAVCKVCG